MTIKYQIIYWRDIPAQVKVKAGRDRAGRPLSKRFPVAIDEAAMRGGLTDSDVYLAQWRSTDWQETEGELDSVADALVADLEEAYPPQRLQRLIEQHGAEVGQE